ncbi:unnamed protein product [Lymnaea stagnalis]|uniref:Alpha-type protein kinase domain-containing protein n=1 Tax=Lymnaea stagnalis TaxID=6523 RepID=A0AAV2HWP3_LYMST
MDKVSNLNKWLAGRKGKRSLDQDEWISIEELIPGDMVRYCPWTFEHHTEDYVESEHLQAFSHFTFMHTNGSLVACDFQGVCERKNSTPRYIFTDSTIHSRCKLYGLFDKGEYGITEFFKLHKCSNICKKWPKPTPLTPPPSFEEACAAQRLHLASAPTFENIVFPARSLSNIILDDEIHQVSPTTRQATGSRRRHQSDHQTRVHIIAQTERQTTISHRHRRRSSSLYDNVSCLTDTSNVSNESQPPAYDSLVATQERPTAFSLDHNRPPSLHDNTHGHHAVLSNSSSCPLLETAQGHHERPPRQALGRSATCDEVDSTRHSTPGLTFEESRVRSWSENVINPNLQQRRIMNLYACQREGGREQIVYLRGLQNELPPLIVPSAPRNPGEYLNDT